MKGKMYHCFLVDDERWVGVDMEKSVHWMDYGFYSPTFFQDPQAALKAICVEKPDVVFTDIRMPGLSGIDLILQLRERKIESEVVILSAYEDFETAQLALRLNVTDYCLKPINVQQLENVLEVLAEKINLKNHRQTPVSAQKGEYSETIRKVVAYIHESIGRRVTLEDIADQFFLNKNYLCSLFHEETGQTFSTYMTNLRIQQAKHLLASTELPITEIAEKLTYCDSFYFTKVFKRKVGMSPFAFRKSNRKREQV